MIIPVKKAKVFILEEDKEQLLLALQSNSLMMVDENIDQALINTKAEDDIVQRAKSVIKKLSNHQEKKGFFDYQEVPYEDFIKEDESRIENLRQIEQEFETFNKLTSENKALLELIERISPFNKMQYNTNQLSSTVYVSFHTGFIPESNYELAVNYLEENDIEHNFFELSNLGYPIIFVLDKDVEEGIINEIKEFNYVDANLPELNMPIAKYISLLKEDISVNNSRLSYLEEKFINSKALELELKILIDQTLSKKDRLNILFKKTEKTVYITGWVREDQVEALEKTISSFTKTYDIDYSEPTENDVVPTAMKNNKFVRQFETITNMFSTPNHQEIDPNPVLSIWYWIIFGIMMGDVGYGLAMVIVFGLFIKLKKPKGSFSQLIHILFYSGFSAIIAGLVFGSFFGADLWGILRIPIPSFSIMDDPLTMLIFSIALGVGHLISGLVLKIKLSLKHKDPLTALADGFSWVSILVGGSIAIVAMMLLNSNILMYIGIGLVAVGVLLILTLAGRDKKGIFSKVTAGLGGLYNSTSYLSDLLSYSRILALALSTSIIALTMNILAGLVQGSVIGFIFSIVIYIIGHSFNFAMGLLSSYVHDSRLQYIEFFNKFYEGGGTAFEPLTFKTEHINEITY